MRRVVDDFVIAAGCRRALARALTAFAEAGSRGPGRVVCVLPSMPVPAWAAARSLGVVAPAPAASCLCACCSWGVCTWVRDSVRGGTELVGARVKCSRIWVWPTVRCSAYGCGCAFRDVICACAWVWSLLWLALSRSRGGTCLLLLVLAIVTLILILTYQQRQRSLCVEEVRGQRPRLPARRPISCVCCSPCPSRR